ncbi:MAG: sensor histidine kinase [Isosphaeraceae bacterium]
MSELIAEALGRKYRIALAIVALLVVGNQALVQPYLVQLTTDAPLINLAGRQRMLSQRLAKAALALAHAPGETAGPYLVEMKETLDLWSASQDRLLHDATPNSWPRPGSAAAREGLAGLEPAFSHMQDAALRMIRAAEYPPPDLGEVHQGLGVILAHEADYLGRMDRIVQLYEREARARVAALRRLGWTVTGLILAILAGIGAFILRPAALLIRRQIHELRQARDDLEARVRERTRELEAAGERHRNLVEQFSLVARTTTIGEMASGLAHELNQPLGAIANYAEGCLVELEAPHPDLAEVRGAIDRLLRTTLRAGRIIDRIRRFVTRHESRHQRFNLNQTVEEVREILRGEAGQRGIAVQVALAPDLPWVWGDPIQIQQVLVNLARNGFDGIAAAQPPDPMLVMQTRRAESGHAEVAIIDNGEGIEPDNLDRVFEAYFSTRAGGMGMGLAICRTLVEAHQGTIAVESTRGIGTTFHLTLPGTSSDDGATSCLHRG